MRLFTLISSWLLWLLCAFYTIGVFLLRTLDRIPPEPTAPDKLAHYTQLFWFVLAMFTAFTVCIYFVRQRFWFSRKRAVGVGFWLLTILFYIAVLIVIVAGFAPYFAGDRSLIQWTSCALGLVFLVAGIPRLPMLNEAETGSPIATQYSVQNDLSQP